MMCVRARPLTRTGLYSTRFRGCHRAKLSRPCGWQSLAQRSYERLAGGSRSRVPALPSLCSRSCGCPFNRSRRRRVVVAALRLIRHFSWAMRLRRAPNCRAKRTFSFREALFCRCRGLWAKGSALARARVKSRKIRDRPGRSPRPSARTSRPDNCHHRNPLVQAG